MDTEDGINGRLREIKKSGVRLQVSVSISVYKQALIACDIAREGYYAPSILAMYRTSIRIIRGATRPTECVPNNNISVYERQYIVMTCAVKQFQVSGIL